MQEVNESQYNNYLVTLMNSKEESNGDCFNPIIYIKIGDEIVARKERLLNIKYYIKTV